MDRINNECVMQCPIPLEERQTQGTVGATKPFDAREASRTERESFTLDDVVAYLRDNTPAYSSAFIGVRNATGALGTFKTRVIPVTLIPITLIHILTLNNATANMRR